MNRIIAIIFCLAVSGIALGDPVKIVAFGGSNTWGKNLGRSDAYPAQLERMLKAAGYDVVVVNEGSSGQTTADELDKVDSVIPKDARIVIFQPGGNDRRISNKHPVVTNTRENIEAIVQKLLDRNILVLFSGNSERRAYVDKFALPTIDEINQLAPDDLQYDREHLTPNGYRIVAEKMLPHVTALLSRLGDK